MRAAKPYKHYNIATQRIQQGTVVQLNAEIVKIDLHSNSICHNGASIQNAIIEWLGHRKRSLVLCERSVSVSELHCIEM